MSRPRSRSVYSSAPVQMNTNLYPSKRRSSKVTFSSSKYNRKASHTRKKRLTPIQEGNHEDKSSSPKSAIQFTRKASLRSIMNNKNSKTKKSKRNIERIKNIFKY